MKCVIAGLVLAVAASAGVYAAIPGAHDVQNRKSGSPTVCGSVVAARQEVRLRGGPVFLTLGHAYADQDFTVVVLGANRARFGVPEALVGRRLCLSGRIRNFLGHPRMFVDSQPN